MSEPLCSESGSATCPKDPGKLLRPLALSFPFVKWKHREDNLISATRCASRRLALRCRCCHPPRGLASRPSVPRTPPPFRLPPTAHSSETSARVRLPILPGGRPAPEAGSQQCRGRERRAPSGGKRRGGRRGKRGARRRGHTCFLRRLGVVCAAAAGRRRRRLAAAAGRLWRRAAGSRRHGRGGSGPRGGEARERGGRGLAGRTAGPPHPARLPRPFFLPLSLPSLKELCTSQLPCSRVHSRVSPSSFTQTLPHTPPHFPSAPPDAWHRSALPHRTPSSVILVFPERPRSQQHTQALRRAPFCPMARLTQGAHLSNHRNLTRRRQCPLAA